MTIGIYSITFKGSSLGYMGQSNNMENRFKEHLREFKRGHSNYKLAESYKLYGTPVFTLIEECLLEELDEKEITLIQELDLIANGLNITNGGNSSGSGVHHNRSKFSEEQICKVFELLTDPKLYNQKSIAELTGVTLCTVSGISRGSVHSSWLLTKYPETYPKLQWYNKLRKENSYKNKIVNTPVLNRVLPIILGPDGTEYANIVNIAEFCRQHNLLHSSLSRVISGSKGYKSHKGFKLKPI